MKGMKAKIIFLFIIIGLIYCGYWLYDRSGLGGPKLGLQDVIELISADIENLRSSSVDWEEKMLKGRELEYFRTTLDSWGAFYYSRKLNGLKTDNVVFVDAGASFYTDRIYTFFISRYKWNVRDDINSYAIMGWDNTLLYINAPGRPREVIRTVEYDMGNGYYISVCMLPVPKDITERFDNLFKERLSREAPKIFEKIHKDEDLTAEEESEYDRIRRIYGSPYLELNMLGKNVIKYYYLDALDYPPFSDEEE